ncbi:MAG: LytR/AlgR family response regulator transcription factor, partial [Butyricicoccus sp.]
FLTSSAEFAVQSYTVGAYFYQLKSIWPESFFRLMDSVIAACSRESSVSLILRCKTGITRVELDKLEYCEVIRRSLLLHKTDGTVLEAAGSMDSLCESLAEHRNFLRIHRSYLVNLEHIQTITPKTLVMSSRAELPIPRGRYNDIKDAYLEHAFQKEQVFLT